MGVLVGEADVLVVARFEGDLGRADVDRIMNTAANLAARRGGPVIYMGIHPQGFSPPSAEMRTYVVDRVPQFLRHTQSLELVLEGNSVGSTLLRTVFRGMVTVARARLGGGPQRSFIHASVAEALHRVQPSLTMPVEPLLLKLARQGLLGTQAPGAGALVQQQAG